VTIRPFTSRPPIAPTPIKLLARAPDAHRFADEQGGEESSGSEGTDP
jgi:hypothetical protein